MNNEITLRTSKGEYLPGQTVYGAVYLHISRPTEANGVTISFKGLETCAYEYECDGRKRLNNATVHVDFSDVTLYAQADCFGFGSYVFPFKFDLPKEIPGTFHCSSHASNTSWEVSVTYVLQARAARAGDLQSSQIVVVYQVQEQALTDSRCGSACSVSYRVPRLFQSAQRIHVTARLIENFKHSGSNMQLRLIVTNPTKLRVTSFRILVLKPTYCNCRKKVSAFRKKLLLCKKKLEDKDLLRYLKLYVRDKMADKMLDNMEYSGDAFNIAPESGPHVVYSKEGDLSSILVDCLELDQLQIPLRERLLGENSDTNISPSVVGKHVKNQYQLEITLVFENNHREVFYLPIPGVLPEENHQWLHWRPPEWAFKAEAKLSRSLFSVQESALHTEAFSGLPSFHVL